MTWLLLLALAATPDHRLTPGAVAPDGPREVCSYGYARLHRPPLAASRLLKRAVFSRYGIPFSQMRFYELDHLIPLCLGGSSALENLWPEPWPDARVKDLDELRLCRAVCSGRMRLSVARALMAGWGR